MSKKQDGKDGKKKKGLEASEGLPVPASLASGDHTDAAHSGVTGALLMNHSYLNEEQFARVAQLLQRHLASTLSLYLKYKKFHWDVRGPAFRELHELYDEQAAVVFSQVDELAERLVMLGGSPVAAPVDLDRYTMVRVPTETIHDGRAQLAELARDLSGLTRALRDDARASDDAGDPVTAGLLTDVLAVHDKHRWMLQALLEQHPG